MTDEKEQAFQARYDAKYDTLPKVDREATVKEKTILLVTNEAGQTEEFPEFCSNVLEFLGVPYESKTYKTVEQPPSWWRTETDPKFFKAALALASKLNGDDGRCTVTSTGDFTVETFSRLGAGAHSNRKAKIEAFYRRQCIEFTLECHTIHESRVCQPLPEEKLVEAMAELSEGPQ